MAITKVQGKLGTSSPLTFDSTTTSGNMIEVTVAVEPSGSGEPTINAPSDNKGNTYTLAVAQWGGAWHYKVAKFYAKNITGGSSHQISVGGTGIGSYSGIEIVEYSGLDTSAPLDKTAGGTNYGTSVTSDSSGTLSQDDELVTAGSVSDAGTVATCTGYTINDASGNFGDAYKVVSATTAVTATWSGTGAEGRCIVLATYKGDTGGGASSTPSSTPFLKPFRQALGRGGF